MRAAVIPQDSLPLLWKADNLQFVILLVEHDEPSLAAKKKQEHVALETATSTPKNRVWGFENKAPGRISCESRSTSETATGSVQFSYETASGQAYYYTRDHLGSVREMTNSSGTIVARYDYDSYGKVTKVSGSMDADFQYAGYYIHASSGLNLTLFRAYDPNTAKWLSRDPIAESGGINLYGYVGNRPINFSDPLGLLPDAAGPLGGNVNDNPIQKFIIEEYIIPLLNDIRNAPNSAEARSSLLLQVALPEENEAATACKAAEEGAGIIAKDGTEITGFTGHGVQRVVGDGADRAGTTPQAILDALKNPKKITEGLDSKGRPFKIYKGADARVVINPQTGKVVSVNPLSGKGAQ